MDRQGAAAAALPLGARDGIEGLTHARHRLCHRAHCVPALSFACDCAWTLICCEKLEEFSSCQFMSHPAVKEEEWIARFPTLGGVSVCVSLVYFLWTSFACSSLGLFVFLFLLCAGIY